MEVVVLTVSRAGFQKATFAAMARKRKVNPTVSL